VAFVLWLALLAGTFLVGWLMYTYVEEPMMRRFATARRAPALVEAPA